MKEYYKDNISTIYKGDYRKLIKKLKFDFVLTDPPYNCNYKYPDYKDNLSDKEYIKLLKPLNKYKLIMIHYPEEFVGILGRIYNKPSKIVSWCYNTNTTKQHRNIGFFNCIPDFKKVRQPYKNPKDKRIIKRVENGSKGARLYDWWDDIQLIKNISKEKNKNFTNQIPIKLLERILLITTNEGDIILDPFFGSGSLYFACKNTNRKLIGIEQSEEHLKVFTERLNTLKK